MSIICTGLQSLREVDMSALARAYQAIYAAPPWGEYKKCNVCEEIFWSSEDKDELKRINYKHCDKHVSDFWPIADLKEMFLKISDQPLFAASVAYDRKTIIGFSWGYQIPQGHIDTDLKLEGVEANINSKYGDNKKICYLADLAVKPKYRGCGLAKKLAKIRHEIFQKNEVDILITRTKGGDNPSVTHLWYEKIGFGVIANYNDSPRFRVIRATPTNQLIW